VKQRGAPKGFVQHTDSGNNQRRKLKAQIGARQLRRCEKAARRP
jgi:hypothetical protein